MACGRAIGGVVRTVRMFCALPRLGRGGRAACDCCTARSDIKIISDFWRHVSLGELLVRTIRRAIGICLTGLVLASLPIVLPAARAAEGNPPPSLENVSYGPHERNVLDLWQAKANRPAPLVVFIHGGGFVEGDKSGIRRRPEIRHCLDSGVSFASINYRFREHAPIQDILLDVARAVQYMRSRADQLKIDPTRIAAYGSSAGAGSSLWLAVHDELADPKSADPVLRQSSHLAAAASLDGQASYDLRDWPGIVGKSLYSPGSTDWLKLYGFKTKADSLSPQADKVMKDCGMIGLITADDPPVAVASFLSKSEAENRDDFVHHPKHSIAVADRCKAVGVDCRLIIQDETPGDRASQEAAVVAFLLEKLHAGD